jgi:hypothetical protein
MHQTHMFQYVYTCGKPSVCITVKYPVTVCGMPGDHEPGPILEALANQFVQGAWASASN